MNAMTKAFLHGNPLLPSEVTLELIIEEEFNSLLMGSSILLSFPSNVKCKQFYCMQWAVVSKSAQVLY
jgi:hypothetical protein